MINLTEKQFLNDFISYAHIKQHEQETTLIHNNFIPTREFATGNKKAWSDVEFLMKQRLSKVEVVE